MRALITGGTGFIGSRLALRLRRDGHEVLALGRPDLPPPQEQENIVEMKTAGVDVRGIAINDKDEMMRALQGRDTVFNLAAIQHEMNVPDERFRAVNVGGVKTLLQCCVDSKVNRFIHGSTIGVHGDGALQPITEESPLAPSNIYDVTKKEGEDVARSYSQQIEIVILRIGETYGPGDRRLLKLFRGIQRRRFFLIGEGLNLHQPIYIDDMVDALTAAANSCSSVGDTILVAGPRALPTREMAEIVAIAVDGSLLPLRAPMWIFLAAAFALEKSLRPLGIQPPLHRRRLNFFRLNLVFSMHKAKKVLQFEPQIDFDEGARLTTGWYREKGLLD